MVSIRKDSNYLDIVKKIQAYCLENQINYLLLMGNIFCFHNTEICQPRTVFRLLKYVEQVAQDFPHQDNIVNLFLGGHNDVNLIQSGVDINEALCHKRIDFIKLGYNHATISFNTRTIRKLTVHHTLINPGLASITGYLGLQQEKHNSDNNYLDIVSSTDQDMINLSDGFVCIPSLSSPDTVNKAYHVRVNLASDLSDIANVTLIPILIDDELIPTAKVVYQKSYVRK